MKLFLINLFQLNHKFRHPQAGGPILVGCPRLLIQYIRSYPPYRRPFLHPQPENAPCRGDRDPLITVIQYSINCNMQMNVKPLCNLKCKLDVVFLLLVNV